MLIIGGLGHGKTNSLFNLISHQLSINEIYLYAKFPYEENQFLINKRKSAALKYLNDSKAFIEYSPYSPFRKAFETQTEKQIGAIKSLDLSKKWIKTG